LLDKMLASYELSDEVAVSEPVARAVA
jgi:hypothetical protein